MNLIDLKRTGQKCADIKKSKIYDDVQEELLPPPVKLGGRNAWVESEIDAVLRARIAGKTDDEVRALVRELVAARKQAA